MEVSEPENGDHLDRDDLLYVSEFLTEFYSFYVDKHDENENLVVTTDDLRAIYEYRTLQNEVERASESERIFDYYNPGSEKKNPYTTIFRDLRKRLDEISPSVRSLEALVHRVEVWSTKAIAQHLLLSHHHQRQHKSDCECWSFILNLPSASYSGPIYLPAGPNRAQSTSKFAQFWDECYNQWRWNKNIDNAAHVSLEERPISPHNPCGLSVPPNAYTWKEYARICHMITLLPHPAAANESAIAKGEVHATHLKWQWRPADLVLLWVRAQRNAQANRHLVQLFQVTTDPDDPTRYKATFRGNHKNTNRRVIQETKLVDQLVQWAVINQGLCTYPLVQALLRSKPKRRTGVPPTSPMLRNPAKRARVDASSTEKDITDDEKASLWWSCQSHFLRAFAQSHRRVLTCLFYSNAKEAIQARKSGLDVDDTALYFLENVVKIQGALPENLRRDRTFARIDRRILLGLFEGPPENDGTMVDKLHETVLGLLRAYEETCRDTNDLHGDDKTTCLKAIQTARVAFDSNYKLLFDQKESRGVVETARSFLRQCTDAESSSVGELLSTLQGLRPPWVERCLECKQSVIRVDKPFRLCVCCRVAMHVECQNDDHPSIYGSKSFVKSCRPLEEVFRVHMPSGLPIPDFTDPSRQNEVTWETKIITIERQVEANGKLQAWGLMLRQTEHCEKCLRKFLRNSVAELENPKEGCPLILPHTGSLVIGMKDTNRQAGKVLQVGDVITGVEFVAFAGIGEAKYASSTLHRLEKMDRKNRGDIFREPATKIRLVVARPSKNLVLEAKRWLEQLQVFNAYQIDLLTENFWFCPQCHWEPTASQTETKGGGDLNRDALHCQAVIRRIARQEECRVFHDENTVNVDSEEESGGKGDENVVSLKRLDNMMDWICNRATHDATDSPRDCSPFFFARRRLSWAPKELESSPFTLLCRGIGLLASPNRKMSNQLHRLSVCRRELLKHFLRAFCSWCLASQPTADLPITTRGPSLYAMRSVFPSEKSYCHCCSVRSLEYPLANAFCTSCLKLASEETTRMDKVVSRCDLVAESYEKCAALVGKSILCLPGDPFLSAASSKLAEIGLTIEHNNRPFQFCIVSYLPHLHGNAGNGGIASGIFHLLPILWPRQLSYVLNRCKLRPPATSFTTEVPKEWGKDGVLELKGVLTLSLKELEDKVAKTKAIYDAIADEVARQADCRCPSNLEAPLRSHRFNGHHASPSTKTLPCASCVTVSAPSGFGVNGWYLNRADLRVLSATIDTLLRSRAPIVLRMLDARRSPPNHEEPLEYQEKEAHVHLPLRFDKKKAPAADVVEFEVIPPGVANYKLLYSDMFFAKTLIQKLSSPLSSPPHDQDEAVEELLNVTLPATEILFERHNVGAFVAWGFELVIWESEAVVRVGRVLQGSAAMSSGLCCNDVVHRINGKVVDRTCSEQFVIWALLALSPVSQHVAHSQRDALATFLQHQSQTKGPVVLQIGRKTSTNQLSNIKEGFDANAASSSGTITRYANGPSVLKQSQIDASAGRATVPLQLPPTSSVPNPLSTPRDWADFTQPGAGNFAGAVSRNNGSRPLQPIYRASDMNYHQLAIDTFIAGSSFISRRHLYVKGLPGTILTLAETAVLLEAISRGHPMLGVRLLCPRYDVSVVYVEIKKLFRLTSLPVPRIHPALWEHITSMDYERSESEPQNGTLCFQDSNYSYRMPTRPFPIDRTIEGIYSRLNARQGTNAPGYNGIQRVRGGGPTHESELAATFLDQNEKSHHQETAEKGKIALSALSDAEKHRTLVCGRCQTSLEGDIRKWYNEM